MTTTATRIATLTLAAAAAITLAGCSSSGTALFGASSSASTPPARQSSPSSPPSQESASPVADSTSTPAPSASSVDNSTDRRVLTSGEVGGDFAKTTGDPQDTPLPCTPNEPGPLAAVPSSSHSQADFVNPDETITITERVITYADAGSAQRVLDVVHRGFGCESADLGGATLQIAGPNDVRSVVAANVEQADDWTLRSEAGEAELIVVRSGRTVVQVVFTSTPGASIQIDPTQVLRTAVAKAINGG